MCTVAIIITSSGILRVQSFSTALNAYLRQRIDRVLLCNGTFPRRNCSVKALESCYIREVEEACLRLSPKIFSDSRSIKFGVVGSIGLDKFSMLGFDIQPLIITPLSTSQFFQ